MAGERRCKVTWGSYQGKESGVGPVSRVNAVKPLGGKEGARGPVLEDNAVKARDKKKCQWSRAERQTCEAFRKKWVTRESSAGVGSIGKGCQE